MRLQAKLLLHGPSNGSKPDVQGIFTREALPFTSFPHDERLKRVRHHQARIKACLDSRRALRKPQFRSEKAAHIFTTPHKQKLHNRYSTSQAIETQLEPATYQFDDDGK